MKRLAYVGVDQIWVDLKNKNWMTVPVDGGIGALWDGTGYRMGIDPDSAQFERAAPLFDDEGYLLVQHQRTI